MSDGWVIDSSIGISWVHPDQATEETAALRAQLTAGPLFLVPNLWFFEMANSLLMLQRRKKISASERARSLDFLEGLHLQIDDESPLVAFHAASELAEKYGLTVYDATYLEVAVRRDLALATRDEPLRQAAKKVGIQTL